MGSIVLGSGNKFTLDLYGDQLINFSIDEGSSHAAVDENGQVMRDGVKNTGSLIADGGTIIVSAKSAQGVLDRAINMEGVAQARSVAQKGGVIILGGHEGVVRVAGKIDASGKAIGSKGGKVKVLAKHVKVEAPTVIDVSGDLGGGEMLIGGNYQGLGPEQNALFTQVGSGVSLYADAITNGDGGRIIVWADET